MRHRLNPFLTVVVRPPTLVQLGASATGAPVLRPPPWLAPDAVAGLLRWLQTYRTPRELERRAADLGMTAGDVEELLGALGEHGLLEPEPPRSPLQVHLHGRGSVADAVLGELAALDGVQVTAGTARSWTPAGRGVDLVVLSDFLSPDPVLVARLMRERVPHLPVVLRDGAGVIGPLVLPGAGPCLRCLDRNRSETDPGWPTLACQLFGRAGRASPQILRMTAAVAAQQVAAVAAGRWGSADPPDVLGCTLEVEGSAIAVRRWFMHPGCGCGVTAPASEAAG
ncbi:hypothetical protein AXK56_13325 [Tsukamurella pulmonis]|uniref:Bacteriocin biosynthesis cyclodehydratase domain-containing protein n=1 Tax=Tsukamurella pulmonis TaxID=47312 RepID=A0A1H1GPY8_9ACTN|nr:hypothetical protein [Tsukamurella pulmonis]KXO88321.1 hypothetical protein AXK56_13325 [Tsukamurella pulmonis]SDR15245.1 bacteriocin biosynthesis cyclodehydratase domain-containing protein [Tsukamurella pulmonis]SUP16882.1 bacteriocin biosynthesis cyclodehydratase domain [Tsukamurella pulmonis]